MSFGQTYLVFIAFSFCLVYLILSGLFSKFFTNKISLPKTGFVGPVIFIIILSFVIDWIALGIHDKQLSNRVLHAFGGGFLAFLVCFLVVRNLGIKITKFQFFIFSFLVVMTLGVGNELIEFFAQSYYQLKFAGAVNDTWLDLMSNFAGALIAGIIFTPFVKSK